MPPVAPQWSGVGAEKAAAKGPGGVPSSAGKGKTGRRGDGAGSAQPHGPPTGGFLPASNTAQPLAPAAGASLGDGAPPEASGVVVWKDTVEPDSVRVLGYTEVGVGPETAASAGQMLLTHGLRADAEPEQPDIYLSDAALLPKRL